MSLFEVRSAGGGTYVITTYAALHDRWYRVGCGGNAFMERSRPGAFKASLERGPDVTFRTEHTSMPLARTTSGTLKLSEDATGLRYEALLNGRDPDVQALIPKVERRDVTESSYAFRADEDKWDVRSDPPRRELLRVDIDRGDVSLVTHGANSATGVMLSLDERGRSLTEEEREALPGIVGMEVRGRNGLVAVERRRDYTRAQLEALGKAGQALWLDGHWAYPTPTRADYDDAVQAVGRTPGKNRERVRVYLRKRARDEGWPIPPSWASDGTTRGSAGRSSTPLTDLRALRRQIGSRPPTARDHTEQAWVAPLLSRNDDLVRRWRSATRRAR